MFEFKYNDWMNIVFTLVVGGVIILFTSLIYINHEVAHNGDCNHG